MKKVLLFALGAMMAMPIVAQEEDVTYLIKNAGFDEDLTFEADGTMKPMVEQQSLSDRSWAYIAADKTVYARPKETSSQQRTDGRSKLDAVNGFHGQVTGWTLEGTTFPKCEWMYYGVVPYGLPTDAVPVADDGAGYLLVPEKPEGFTGDDNKGMLYMRAGWTNSCSYKQVVKLPCAQYRLEYWTINMNPNSSSTATDLTEIVCRKDHFKDESGTGLSATTWTKHEFEFTPTAEFTMVFGYASPNQTSNNNPWVCLDGIKLYKIGEADELELLQSDLDDLADSVFTLSQKAQEAGLTTLSTLLVDYAYGDIQDALSDDAEAMKESYSHFMAEIAKFNEAIEGADALKAILEKMEVMIATTDYPGKDAFKEKFETINAYVSGAPGKQTAEELVELLLAAPAEANAAILAYLASQGASESNPADFTMLVQNPWFISADHEPADDNAKVDAEVVEDVKTWLNSTGWYVSGETGGDQNAKICQLFPCWNAWKTAIGTVSVSQDLSGLPNGYYQVSALLITQPDYANQTQHVFASTTLGTFNSDNLQVGNWDGTDNTTGNGEWVRLTTESALVTDGKLTIGAAGQGLGATDQSGWFCVTGFKLYYLGEAGSDAVQNLLGQKQDEARAFAQTMHFAADKAALEEAINAGGEPTEALAALNAALAEAKTSEAKYEEYMQEGKTLPTVQEKLAGDGYEAATDIVRFAYDYVMTWLGSSEATYKQIDSQVNLLKNYLQTYAPVYNEAAELAETSATAKAVLGEVMGRQKAELTAEMQTAEKVNEFVSELKLVMVNVKKQVIWETAGATDYSGFIVNPNAEAETGWTFNKGTGDGPIKSGQWFNGDETVRYFDSWNSNGLKGFNYEQLVVGLPNGTYTLGVYARTTGEGAYVFNAADADAQKNYVEIPVNTFTDAEGIEQVASDTHGPIWEAAEAAYNAGSTDEEVLAIYNANGGNGRGWKHIEMTVVVSNHRLLIGSAAGNDENQTLEKDYEGSWYSTGGWTLTLVQAGNNDGWEGPLADGIERIVANGQVADGIYSLNGVKLSKMQRGLNIIMMNGKAVKVMVK